MHRQTQRRLYPKQNFAGNDERSFIGETEGIPTDTLVPACNPPHRPDAEAKTRITAAGIARLHHGFQVFPGKGFGGILPRNGAEAAGV